MLSDCLSVENVLTSLDLVLKPSPIAVSVHCNLVDVAVVLSKVDVKSVGDKSRQVGVVLAVLGRQNDC